MSERAPQAGDVWKIIEDSDGYELLHRDEARGGWVCRSAPDLVVQVGVLHFGGFEDGYYIFVRSASTPKERDEARFPPQAGDVWLHSANNKEYTFTGECLRQSQVSNLYPVSGGGGFHSDGGAFEDARLTFVRRGPTEAPRIPSRSRSPARRLRYALVVQGRLLVVSREPGRAVAAGTHSSADPRAASQSRVSRGPLEVGGRRRRDPQAPPRALHDAPVSYV